MTDFEIKKQVRLPVSRCAELVLSGIRFRLFRASVTMTIVALAVAFLMTILGETLIARRVADRIGDLLQPRQVFLLWTQRLSVPLDDAAVARILQDETPGSPRLAEFRSWGGCTDEDLARLKTVAMQEKKYLECLDSMSESRRRRLVGGARGRETFRHLQRNSALVGFIRSLPEFGDSFPGSASQFRQFLAEWAATAPLRERIMAGHRAVVKELSVAREGYSLMETLAGGDHRLIPELARVGFVMTEQELDWVVENAARSCRQQKLSSVLANPRLQQSFALRYGIADVKDVTPAEILERLSTRSGAAWFVGQARMLKIDVGGDGEEIRCLASSQATSARLAGIESLVQGSRGEGRWGLSGRVLALIVVSLLVCVVGIANAMLMSVTERFKEIATMKCLGATDGFVMINFVTESGFQGLVGACVGGFLGAALGVSRAALSYGGMAISCIPPIAFSASLISAVAVGVALSILAAVYPAWVAARLSPMEAMRVE